jgi:hypothetical protein
VATSQVLDREEILHRYRELRLQAIEVHTQAVKHLSRDALFEAGRVLGVLQGKTFILDSAEEMALVSDYAIHAVRKGANRAIDRYRRAMNGGAGALIEAMCDSRFSIWEVERRHDVAGLILEDVVRGQKVWLIDESFEESGTPGMVIAARLCRPGDFWMSLGALVPIDELVIERIAYPKGLALTPVDQALEDPRFAGMIYRAAIKHGVMDSVVYR